MNLFEKASEAVSKLDHSPGPWRQDWWQPDRNEQAWCIRDAHGGTVVEGDRYSSGPLDNNGALMAAAPTMYAIIRQICNEDWEERLQGLRSAQYLLQELEGEPVSES